MGARAITRWAEKASSHDLPAFMRDTRGWKQGNDVPAGRAKSLDSFVLVCLLVARGLSCLISRAITANAGSKA